MPKQKNDDLLALICSLSKAEKRHFRLFVSRNSAAEDLLFLQLFDYLDKKEEYDEADIIRKLPGIKKHQLSNLKAHLYGQLLTSLRLLARNQQEDMLLRERLDHARILYNKGLYRQSLDVLAKTKERALQGQFHTLALEALEFEILIEGQYITRSIEGRAEALTRESEQLQATLGNNHHFANLSLQLYGLFLKAGFARNPAEYAAAKAFFEARLPGIAPGQLDFWGRVYYHQSHFWLYHIGQEFSPCFRHTMQWVRLFEQQPRMMQLNAPLYLKGLHNLLGTLAYTLDYRRFTQYYAVLLDFPQQYPLARDQNVEGLYWLYHFLHRINKHYMEGSFSEGAKIAPEIEACIVENRYNWDRHRVMLFYYRIACLYFGKADYERSIDYLNKIINQKTPDYRADIQCFARILNLIAHFELGNMLLVQNLIKSVYRFLLHIEDLQQVQREIFYFLRRIPDMSAGALTEEFRALRDKLLPLREDRFERRPFMYLDIITWLETKLEGRSIEELVGGRFLREWGEKL